MKETESQFNAQDLLQSVEETRDHLAGKRKVTLRTTQVQLPEPAPEITPEAIMATRKALNVSQPVFARMLNVATVTAISWEKGRRKPSGAALRLLQIANRHPETLLEA